MPDVQIVCPSHGRAGEVTAFRTFGPDLLLCVAQSQLPAYREAYPEGRFDVHPDSVKGLGPKVTWMREKYGDCFFRVDDDADYMIDQMASEKITDPRKARALVYRLADQAEQMGCFLYGFTELARPVYYSGHQPFKLSGLIEGGKIGFLPGSRLWWPDELPWLEDAWLAALNAHYHRFCLIDMRYCLPTLVGQKGGLAAHRTVKRVFEMGDYLRNAFGSAIEMIPVEKWDGSYPYRLRIPW
jgi:hypothetical protein